MHDTGLDHEIALYKRRKGKKLFTIFERLTSEGADRKRKKCEEDIKEEQKWSKWWSKYEKLKSVEQALESIEKQKRIAPGWRSYLRDYEHKIVEKGKEDI